MKRIKTWLVAIGVMPAGPLSVIYLHLLQSHTHTHMSPRLLLPKFWLYIFVNDDMVSRQAKHHYSLPNFFSIQHIFPVRVRIFLNAKPLKGQYPFNMRSLFVRHAGVPLSFIFLMDSIFGCWPILHTHTHTHHACWNTKEETHLNCFFDSLQLQLVCVSSSSVLNIRPVKTFSPFTFLQARTFTFLILECFVCVCVCVIYKMFHLPTFSYVGHICA